MLHHAEDADLLVLVDVVQVADGDDVLRGDLVVIGLDALWDARLPELRGRVRADARQLGEPEVRGRRLRAVVGCPLVELGVDVADERVGDRGVADRRRPQPLRKAAQEGRELVKPLLVFPFGGHRGLLAVASVSELGLCLGLLELVDELLRGDAHARMAQSPR